MGNKKLLLGMVALVLFVAVAGVAAYKVWPLLNPELEYIAALDDDCDLRGGPCQSVLPDNALVSFAIEPREIPLVQPLKLTVDVTGVEVDSVEIDFAGVDMNMGYNRPKLEKTGDGQFAGEGILPVCVRDAMEWEARVLLKTDDGLVAAPYRFITVKPGMALPQ
ncbi:MAG: hypothetical protein MI754_16775 [Chromatiales bacterium]|nr:hypothetical protein [Chromatiales bacterium]